MIVVGFVGATGRHGEMAVEVARRAAATGARVEMVGVAAPDADGDAVLVKLARAGIGHATVIRTGASGLEAADLDLALRYLPDIRAIVLIEPGPELLAPSAAASGWSGAGLVIVTPKESDTDPETAVAPLAIVLEPPAADPDGTFAGLVAALAVRIDAGDDPATAWKSTTATLAVDAVSRS